METLQLLVNWLSENESALSAVAALTIIAGIFYGALRFVLAPFFRVLSKSPKSDRDLESGVSADREDKVQSKASESVIPNSEATLAVLMFDALSENKDDEYTASGITSEVIAHVTMVPHIRVSSRLVSFGYKSGAADLQKVSEQLNTRFILTGTLRRVEDHIMVIAQLTDVQEKTEIWAQTYDRHMADIFAVQHDIAKCIVGAVLGEVKFAETAFAGAVPEHQLDAWGLVQKAFHFWLTSFSPEGVMQATKYLEQAIELDPNYSSARAALAMLLTQQLNFGFFEDTQEKVAEARTLIETAYQQNPNDIDVLENAGVVWQNTGDSARAQLALRRAIDIAPLNLIARGYLALLLSYTGSEDEVLEALELIDNNFATAPKHPSVAYWNYFAAVAYQRLGDNEQAIAVAKKSLVGQPGWVWNYLIIANAHCNLNDVASATVALENAAAINPMVTPSLYHENLTRMVADRAVFDLFIGGLIRHNLVAVPE